MFKVLASLVVAMTLTAGLLITIEPSQTTAQSLLPALAAVQAERAVTDKVQVGVGRWHQIDVAICPEPIGPRATALAAIVSSDQYHFVIGATGLVQATASWLEQAAIGLPADVVRVGIACENPSGELPAGQRAALEALIRELHNHLSPNAGWRSVSIQNTIVTEASNSGLAHTLRAILADIGLPV